MLIQFNFRNYKSFKDESTLDFTSTKESELSYHIRNVGSENVLPVAVIYGANASGKSNVLEALEYMQTFVLNSLNFGEESKDDRYIEPTPFLFDRNSEKDSSSFEVFFISSLDPKGSTFQYGFEVDDQGVVEEWLNYKTKTGRKYSQIFYRSREKKILELDGIEAKSKENLRIALTDKTLLVSLGAKLKIEKLRIIFSFFNNMEFTNFGEPIQNLMLSGLLPSNIVDDENVRKDVLKYFSTFDESIIDLRVEVVKEDKDKRELTLNIDAGHKVIGSDEIKYIPLKLESAGTLKMFALYPFIREILENGGILVVDELNARLHPLLVRNFVQMFMSPEINTNNAQLIFTSHDSWQLNSGTYRRDEIWFTDKDFNGVSQLYSLADFSGNDGKKLVRSAENFEKNYLVGKYGGIPNMKLFDFSRRDNEIHE